MSETKQQKTIAKEPPVRTPFKSAFFVANTLEIFERLAWYGFFTVSSLYMTSPTEQGGMGFSDQQRGVLQGIIPFLLYLLPVFTGALGDRYGYKKMFILSFCIMSPSYYLLGQVEGFWPFFTVFLAVAVGAAIFKPLVVGTVSRTTDDSNRALGFGVFYTMVNVGGFLGPLAAGMFRAISWDLVFTMSAVWIAINFIPVLLFYRDPTRSDEPASERQSTRLLAEIQAVLGNGRFAVTVIPVLFSLMLAGGQWVSWRTTGNVISVWLLFNLGWHWLLRNRPFDSSTPWYRQPIVIGNGPFLTYLLVMSGFWTIYIQLFITLPLYIRDFLDTHALVMLLHDLSPSLANAVAVVNVEALSSGLQRLHASYAGVLDGAATKAIMMELASFQVRVPMEEIRALFQSGTPMDPLSATSAAQQWSSNYRQLNPEFIMAFNFGSILVFQIIISRFLARLPVLPVLVAGTLLIALSFLLAGFNPALGGLGIVVAVLIFSFGEMIASPKSQEYVAAVMPTDKAAMFMGYYFVSMALGFLFGGILSGWSYDLLAREMGRPDLMWASFAVVGVVTAVALVIFNKTLAHRLEAQ